MNLNSAITMSHGFGIITNGVKEFYIGLSVEDGEQIARALDKSNHEISFTLEDVISNDWKNIK